MSGYAERVPVVPSLDLHFERLPDGRVAVIAPWMDEPFEADTWVECWDEAFRQRREHRRGTLHAAE